MLETLNDWIPLISLLTSILAIVLSVYISRQTSKEAARQIESMKELTDHALKRIESIEIESREYRSRSLNFALLELEIQRDREHLLYK